MILKYDRSLTRFLLALSLFCCFLSEDFFATPEPLTKNNSQTKEETTKKSSPLERLTAFFEQALGGKQELPLAITLALTFFAGVLTSFTPCVYPMIPVTIGILQSQVGSSIGYNFLSSLSYVLGISVVYASLGYLAATTHSIFGQWLGNPFFIFFITLFFLYFAFSLLGFYELYIPRFLQARESLQGVSQKNLLSTFVYGMISGTIVSPCLTPALALVLGLAARSNSPLIGFFYLLFFSLGMGVLLVLVGTFSSTLSLLPQSGLWMEEIKKAFGFICMGIAVSFLGSFVSQAIIWELYALIIFIASLYYFMTAQKNGLKIIVGVLLLILAATLLGLSIKQLITQ